MNRTIRWTIALAVLTIFLAPSVAVAHGLTNHLLGGTHVSEGEASAAQSSARYAAPTFTPIHAQGAYRIYFDCMNMPQPERGDVENATLRCPMDIRDEADILSQPIMLIDPKDNAFMAFNALHGGRGVDDTPTNISRNNFLHQPHTTFYVASDLWNDNPYYSPLNPHSDRQNTEDLPAFLGMVQLQGRRVFGEDNAAVLDAQGRVYLASLYAYRDEGETEYKYAFAFFKAQRVNRPVDYNANIVHKFAAGEIIRTPHLVYVPAVDRVAAVWLETNATDPKQTYLNLAYTIPGKGGIWHFLKPNQRIGNCLGITNPVAVGHEVFVGCFATAGYRHNPNVTAGHLQLHAFDTRGDRWEQRYVDEVYGIEASSTHANAILGHMYDRRLFLAQGGLSPRGDVVLQLTYSGPDEPGRAWDQPTSIAGDIQRNLGVPTVGRPPGVTVTDSRVMAAAFVTSSGSVHLVYKEKWKYAEEQPLPQGAPEYYKALVSVSALGSKNVLGLLNLDVDKGWDPRNPQERGFCQPFDAVYQGSGRSIFNDFKDSIVVWKDRTGREREYVMFGDSGCTRTAEVKEENVIAPIFPVSLPIPPIPAPVAGINPAQIGVLAGALSGAMVLRMLAFKRKLAVEAPA